MRMLLDLIVIIGLLTAVVTADVNTDTRVARLEEELAQVKQHLEKMEQTAAIEKTSLDGAGKIKQYVIKRRAVDDKAESSQTKDLQCECEDGADGRDGIPGSPGIPGHSGIHGTPGFPGRKGESGEQGEAGATGPIGPTGPTGLRGLTGLQGPSGQKGELGMKGNLGTTGSKGSKGLRGLPGPVASQPAPVSCGSSYTRNPVSNTCIRYVTSTKDWTDAKEFCESDGGHLATFETLESASWLNNRQMTQSAWQYRTWIGGYRSGTEWIWIGRVSGSINFSFWDHGQPQHRSGENCLATWNDDGERDFKWHDVHCHLTLRFFCER